MLRFLIKGEGRSAAELSLVSPVERDVRVSKGLCSCNLKFWTLEPSSEYTRLNASYILKKKGGESGRRSPIKNS